MGNNNYVLKNNSIKQYKPEQLKKIFVSSDNTQQFPTTKKELIAYYHNKIMEVLNTDKFPFLDNMYTIEIAKLSETLAASHNSLTDYGKYELNYEAICKCYYDLVMENEAEFKRQRIDINAKKLKDSDYNYWTTNINLLIVDQVVSLISQILDSVDATKHLYNS